VPVLRRRHPTAEAGLFTIREVTGGDVGPWRRLNRFGGGERKSVNTDLMPHAEIDVIQK
jgi:hypothetical protein